MIQLTSDRSLLDWLLTTRLVDIGALIISVTTIIVSLRNSMNYIKSEIHSIKRLLECHEKDLIALKVKTDYTREVQDHCPFCQRDQRDRSTRKT